MTKVISLGGSIVAPEGPDAGFLRGFTLVVRAWLAQNPANRLILVVGGGGAARTWQKAYRETDAAADSDALDWIGIMATRLNAQLVRSLFLELCPQEVVTDPTAIGLFSGRILVAAGWKPGFSTDFDAVLLAERFMADTIVNLSNIAQVYTADPKLDPAAQALDIISWADFRRMVGDEWAPGKNTPFDPVASRRASEIGLKVVCAAGRDLDNFQAILEGRSFIGTAIG
ncbi:MAG: UMP kinase [Spirochaetes bacterium GWD1_61_31]|nr:MAG: UMP kinase [Spirochaetes bacterium GWB1_60_80]OHD32828.1 MAG: UMP kinase [Spirochaetes bacterium GWC1_61_12]OHD35071.1 MAG: UMP kinase [Spirochaetes bacterium GWD1_61_31]OHD42763.1 MAG: UMP kinase [Spirochaetes bacterium GWE1_60_18]OHD58615.1 MAG: UMP kinase [Spirochaetes bacterium GWF1_60_12]HAP44451.1 UMP kinase [Spirochaetaceae bacterium]